MISRVYARIYPYSFDKENCITISIDLDNITLNQAMKEIDRRYPDHDIKEIYRGDHLIAKNVITVIGKSNTSNGNLL